MKIKGKIRQIIKWEEKERFFHSTDYGDTEVDLLNVGSLGKVRWHDKWAFGLFKSFLGLDKPVFKYGDITLDVGGGMPVLVERPHDFQEGDVVEIEISLKKGEGEDE